MALFRLVLRGVDFKSAVILLAFHSLGKGAVSASDGESGKMAWVNLLPVLRETQTPLAGILPVCKQL